MASGRKTVNIEGGVDLPAPGKSALYFFDTAFRLGLEPNGTGLLATSLARLSLVGTAANRAAGKTPGRSP